MHHDMYKDAGATFSTCRAYRYELWRIWDRSKPYLMVIGLNPSTADETEDDPTIRRCKRFAADWGYGGLFMCNLFALRATDPNVLIPHPEPIGPDNDKTLINRTKGAGMVLAAWGNIGTLHARDRDVRRLIEDKAKVQMKCLGTTKIGQPKHPLYIKADTVPVEF